MSFGPGEDFIDIFKKTLKKNVKINDKDLSEAVNNMLIKSNIKNFNEYIRTFKYRNYQNIEDSLEKYKYKKYFYRHAGDLLGHSGQIERITFDNTGKHVVSGGSDGMIKFWDVETGFLIHTCIGHRNLVNDLCFSKDGKFFVSCDFNGIINVWDLSNFTIHFTIRCFTGVTFSEFFEIKSQKDVYNLVVIFCNGLVKVYKFNLSGLVEEKENDFTLDEPYKAICITDGGRFLLRAGYWPYLILLDTYNIDKCVIFETNNLQVQTICAAKDCLKFAAGCGNWLFQWTYFYEGCSSMGNFSRTTKIIAGHWKKTVFKLDTEDSYQIDNMSYLKNGYLACVCTDLKIRIYSDRILRYTVEVDEMGSICAHPFENIFAYHGQFLKFYFLDKLINCEKINFTVNDCQFSNDGDYFVIGDELGNVRTFSLNHDKYIFSEQFFLSDFEHFTTTNNTLYRECKNDCTLDSNRNKNEGWLLIDYFSRPINNAKNVLIEEAAFVHLISKYLDKSKYKRKFCAIDIETTTTTTEIEESEGSVDFSDESCSDTQEIIENENRSSEEEIIVRRRGVYKDPILPVENKISVTLRRNYIESIEYPKPRMVRLRRTSNNEDEGLEFFHYQRKSVKKRKKTKEQDSLFEQGFRRKSSDSSSSKIRLRRHMLLED